MSTLSAAVLNQQIFRKSAFLPRQALVHSGQSLRRIPEWRRFSLRRIRGLSREWTYQVLLPHMLLHICHIWWKKGLKQVILKNSSKFTPHPTAFTDLSNMLIPIWKRDDLIYLIPFFGFIFLFTMLLLLIKYLQIIFEIIFVFCIESMFQFFFKNFLMLL